MYKEDAVKTGNDRAVKECGKKPFSGGNKNEQICKK